MTDNAIRRIIQAIDDNYAPLSVCAKDAIFELIHKEAGAPASDSRELARKIYDIASQGVDEWLHKFDGDAAARIDAFRLEDRRRILEEAAERVLEYHSAAEHWTLEGLRAAIMEPDHA